ncbi:hypothetical protein O6H91_10G077200 [Diphasiastrum complanatum]|uniref:Uncharacterized protein n=1 Tax=Diphasiastrum complanatum TaxID=34168 RepID=A0ACC2CIC6_DIPCM|nr:hypothetical protein O6H91_10G077200 [Diphasiastrum complanatum]
MSWGLGSWKRPADTFHLTLGYGDESHDEEPSSTTEISSSPVLIPSNSQPQPQPQPQSQQPLKPSDVKLIPAGSFSDLTSGYKFRIAFDWSSGDDEDQVALRLQSQLMVALPPPFDEVQVRIEETSNQGKEEADEEFPEKSGKEGDQEAMLLHVSIGVQKRREPLKVLSLSRTVGSGPSVDGLGVLAKLLGSGSIEKNNTQSSVTEGLLSYTQHWQFLTVLNLSNCSLTVLPVDLARLPMLEKLYLDNNKISVLPPEIGQLAHLSVLRADHNLLVSVPAELRQCSVLIELSLEYNKLVRPLLDFRAMLEVQVLRLFGNPLEFLPEILPCSKLRYLSLANVRIEGDQISDVNVQIETENTSYFIPSKHKLSAFFALIFRFSSCQHPLLASALAKLTQDTNNCAFMAKDESAVRQLLSMMLSENRHVVEQACFALSSLASDGSLVSRLMKADIMQAIECVLRSSIPGLLISVLKVVTNLAFTSDAIAAKMLTKDVLKRLKVLCAHADVEVQRQTLLAVGNLAFCRENRRALVASESLRDMLLRLSGGTDARVTRAAARALAIFGENEYLRRAVKGRPLAKQGLRILSMDGGGMRGLATVQMLRSLEQGTGRRIHESFDLICGTSTGGMLAVALGIKRMTLDQCEEIYKTLGKLVFSEPVPRDNEAATWREKLDQLYKSSSQNFRVVVHGSKHNADQFERLLRDVCSDEDGDLLIDTAVKGGPKVFVVSSLVSVTPAQPFVFRNYQYPAGTPEAIPWTSEGPAVSVSGTPATAAPLVTQVGPKRSAFIGSCKHRIWEAIRASSAAPYYLDDFSIDNNRWQDGAIVANNPTLIAVREAQLLWPDTQIACLVSVGCGNLPSKLRGKGGWRYLDTGQVLIESACSVERVEEALDTLLPMLPDIQYFRFNPVDERCGMELDETDQAVWLKLEAATQEYVEANTVAFQAACEQLMPLLQEEDAWSERSKAGRVPGRNRPANKRWEETFLGLGRRRRVFLIEASQSPELLKPFHHTRSLEAFCARHSIKLETFSGISGALHPTSSTITPFASPLLTGSIPASPLPFSPELGPQALGRSDVVPPLSLDGLQNQAPVAKATSSPPSSPTSVPHQLLGPVLALHEKMQSSPHVGVVHFALHSDATGLTLSWRNDVFAVAEPGELAEEFLKSVMESIRFCTRSRTKKRTPFQRISSLLDLVAEHPRFVWKGALHRFVGRHTQVLLDGQEVGAYLFRRTLAASHLTPEDVRWMVGAWRERIVICTGKYGPPPALVKAFLDAGAKAVISPAQGPPDLRYDNNRNISNGDRDLEAGENGRFVIADEEEEMETNSVGSDWEDSDMENNESGLERQRVEEKDLAAFICLLYDALFREGIGAEAALQRALDAYPKQNYCCHVPKI